MAPLPSERARTVDARAAARGARACAALVLAAALSGPSPAQAAPDGAKARCAAKAEEGQRERLAGRLVRARDALVACADDACPDVVRRSCGEWLGEVDRELPTLAVVVRDAKGNARGEVPVTLDGAPVEALEGRAIPVDPGRHRLRAVVDGTAVEREVVVVEGRKAELVELSLPLTAPAPAAATAPSPDRAEPTGTFTTGRVVALVAGGIGLGLAGTGGVLALGARSRYQESAPFCSGNACQDEGLAIRQDAIDRAGVATALAVSGLALTAGAVVLWLVTPPRSARTAASPFVLTF